MFKRRDKRSLLQILRHWVYPPGGWGRGLSYLSHRVRRLPDPPHRIARGLAAGIFVSFSPFFGLHLFLAALVAWAIRGNILASLLATLIGNPVTFPFLAAAALWTGEHLFAVETAVPLPKVLKAFSEAAGEVADNLVSLITGGEASWSHLSAFFDGVFMPYLIGGTVSGMVAAVFVHYLSLPLLEAYQRRRAQALGRAKREARPGPEPDDAA